MRHRDKKNLPKIKHQKGHSGLTVLAHIHFVMLPFAEEDSYRWLHVNASNELGNM